MKVLSAFFLVLICLSSISSLKLKLAFKSFTLTCKNYSLLTWVDLQADCEKRDKSVISSYIDIAHSTNNNVDDFRVS